MDRQETIRTTTSARMLGFVGLSLSLIALLAQPGLVQAQHDGHGDHGAETNGGHAAAEVEVPLMTAVLGSYTRPIDTAVPLAQAYFDQGMQMVFAFTYPVAIRSFQEAQRQDPSCAMCYWGEALARGPFLNGGLTSGNAEPAYAAAQHALSLVDEGTDPLERGLIEAMAVRYAERHDPEQRAALDSAYSRAMAGLFDANPDDLDVGTLYAESLMLLDPARGQYRADDPFVQSFHRVLEGVLAADLSHPGACHLYIHATEATAVARNAEPCADILMTSIPGASHLNHMPSHTYNVIGEWGKAVRSNVLAWHSDQRTAFGEGVSYGASHNLHMLFFAASMDGQGALAARAANEYAQMVPGGHFYEAMVLLRFGRFDEVLALTETPDNGLRRGLWEFSRGYAHLRAGSPDSAAIYLARVDEAAATLPETMAMRGHTASDLLGITGDILRAEILREEGRLDEAIAALERSVETFVGLRYDEPEPLNFSPRHWLGAVLLEAGRPAEAERVYREAIEQHDNNGWSIFGLEQALRAQGRDAEADAARHHFNAAWERADIMIRSSRF
jgi:tetratricopeptide (TPR) repeat protein